MKKYESQILNALLDQYERSKSFIGANKVNQSFSKRITELCAAYADEANYEIFSEVNEQVAELERKGLISVKRKKRGKTDTDIISAVILNTECLANCYKALGRKPKADQNAEIRALLTQYADKTPLLKRYCEDQLKKLDENRKINHSNDLNKLEQILKVLAEIEKVEEETFIRNFSVKVLSDSKAFERIKTAVVSILCEYGDFPDKDCVLEDLNIVKNPGYVYVKGKAVITLSGQQVDLSVMDGELGLSSALLNDIEKVKILGSKVITIENLTTFNTYSDSDAFILYLGGYHNSIRRKMIRKIYEDNPEKNYFHYGDIDAGGYYILLDLRSKTGIDFIPLNMDIETLQKYGEYTKKLTENDKVRLKNLLGGEFDAVIRYMLENDCKLEQEAT